MFLVGNLFVMSLHDKKDMNPVQLLVISTNTKPKAGQLKILKSFNLLVVSWMVSSKSWLLSLIPSPFPSESKMPCPLRFATKLHSLIRFIIIWKYAKIMKMVCSGSCNFSLWKDLIYIVMVQYPCIMQED